MQQKWPNVTLALLGKTDGRMSTGQVAGQLNSTAHWHYIERGDGCPLVLLHGIGMASTAWLPVMEQLAAERRVLAFDLPGFGETKALPQDADHSPKAMAEELARVLYAMGIPLPVDIAGNSLGALIALEFAKIGLARSVVGISPAGLWRRSVPRWVKINLRLLHWAVTRIPRLAKQIMHTRAGRTIFLSIPVARKGGRISTNEAVSMLETFAKATDFEAVAQAALVQFRDGKNISIPVTIAFGDKDWLLRKKESQYSDELPPNHRWLTLRGCGHVPMFDDPDAVTKLILGGTDVASSSTSVATCRAEG